MPSPTPRRTGPVGRLRNHSGRVLRLESARLPPIGRVADYKQTPSGGAITSTTGLTFASADALQDTIGCALAADGIGLALPGGAGGALYRVTATFIVEVVGSVVAGDAYQLSLDGPGGAQLSRAEPIIPGISQRLAGFASGVVPPGQTEESLMALKTALGTEFEITSMEMAVTAMPTALRLPLVQPDPPYGVVHGVVSNLINSHNGGYRPVTNGLGSYVGLWEQLYIGDTFHLDSGSAITWAEALGHEIAFSGFTGHEGGNYDTGNPGDTLPDTTPPIFFYGVVPKPNHTTYPVLQDIDPGPGLPPPPYIQTFSAQNDNDWGTGNGQWVPIGNYTAVSEDAIYSTTGGAPDDNVLKFAIGDVPGIEGPGWLVWGFFNGPINDSGPHGQDTCVGPLGSIISEFTA